MEVRNWPILATVAGEVAMLDHESTMMRTGIVERLARLLVRRSVGLSLEGQYFHNAKGSKCLISSTQ